MAKYVDFNPIMTPDDQLGQLPVNEGNFIITDGGKIYVDTYKERIPVSGEKGEKGDQGEGGGISELSPSTPVTGIADGKILGVADGKVTGMDFLEEFIGSYPITRVRSLQFIGDSITARSLQAQSVSSLASDASGKVTLSTNSDIRSKEGDLIRVQNATPLSFNGDFIVESAPTTKSLIFSNPNVPPNTTATVDMSALGSIILAQPCDQGAGYPYVGAALAEGIIPPFRIDAMTSTSIQNWYNRLDTYVYPHDCEYIHVLIGTNDMGQTVELTKTRMSQLLDTLLIKGYKVISGTVTPASTGGAAVNAKIDEFNIWLKDYCGHRNIPVVDYNASLKDSGGAIRADCFEDNLHPSNKGHVEMGKVLAAVLKSVFDQDGMLPISAQQNAASGANMLDDPLIGKTPTISTQSGVTGAYGVETVVSISGGTAVSSVIPRDDGYGNDVQAVSSVSGSKTITFDTSYSRTFTASVDSVVIPMFALDITGSATSTRASWSFVKNGAASRTLNMTPYTSPMSGKMVCQGNPLYLKAGDTLSGVHLIAAIGGTGEITVRLGRVMARIMPLLEYQGMQKRQTADGVSQDYVDTQDAVVLAAAKAYTDEHGGGEGGGGKGDKGDPGEAATITVGTTTTTEPGTFASVVNAGTPNAAVFNFSIPRGAYGSGGGGGAGIQVYTGTEEAPYLMTDIPDGFCGLSGYIKTNPNGVSAGTVQKFTDTSWGWVYRMSGNNNAYFFTVLNATIYIWTFPSLSAGGVAYSAMIMNDVLRTTGSQTISSVKTFATLPESSIVPTKDTQFVTKAYVDALFAQLSS